MMAFFKQLLYRNAPAILWDIDGNLNPTFSTTREEDGFIEADSGFMRFWLNPNTHGVWMQELDLLPVRNYWVSNWAEDSNFINRFFDLKHSKWDAIPLDEYANALTWKLPSVRLWADKQLSPSQKLVWLDDELEADAFRWAEERGNTLLVKTNPAKGFTVEQYQLVRRFLEV